jgi:hypothetical protein
MLKSDGVSYRPDGALFEDQFDEKRASDQPQKLDDRFRAPLCKIPWDDRSPSAAF